MRCLVPAVAAAMVLTFMTAVPAAADATTDPLSEVDERNDEFSRQDEERRNAFAFTVERIEASTLPFVPPNSTVPLRPEASTLGLEIPSQEAVILRSDLLFAFDSAELSDAARRAVTELAQTLPQGASITVDGHTDSVGDPGPNQTLSEQRSAAVAMELAAARPDLIITTRGFGETQPIAQNTRADGSDDAFNRSLNRRVEVRVG